MAELTILQHYLLPDPTLFQGPPDLTATKTQAGLNPVELGNALWSQTFGDHPLGLE